MTSQQSLPNLQNGEKEGIASKVSTAVNTAAEQVKSMSSKITNGAEPADTTERTSNTHIYNATDPVEDRSHQIISSYFLGPQAENFEWFKQNIIEILESQRNARLDYFPTDGKFITEAVQASTAFRKSSRRMTRAVQEAVDLLGEHSIPFWSPRYQGHMCMDLSMPALLGYFMTMLYNPNNVSIEASPITTIAEIEVGEQLCNLFGYNTDPEVKELPTAWGHITCDGTIANLESMWVARNLKFYPFSLRWAMEEGEPLNFIAHKFKVKTCKREEKLFSELSKWELLNLRPEVILDIPEQLYTQYYISPSFLEGVMKVKGIQSVSKDVLEKKYDLKDARYFLSNTRHYSWPKSGAIMGIGSRNIIGLKVDHGARVSLDDLRAQLQTCLDDEIPVYAVVAIIGSTEEGAVDPLAGIIRMREEFQQKGLSFLIHGDGAWGGYFCTMLPDKYKPGDEIALPSDDGSGEGFVPDAGLRAQTTEDLFMLRFADSVTVDPHKAAYIPYPAGGLCYRDGRMRYQVTWTSPYISRGETTATSIGVFGVEGSKPGASVMSTWFSNACIGLGPEGYGTLLGEVTFTCSRIAAQWAAMSVAEDPFVIVPLNELPCEVANENCSDDEIEAEREKIRSQILNRTNQEIVSEDKNRPDDQKAMKLLRQLGSDLNINAFSCNWKYEDGTINDEVEEANYFNQLVIQDLSVDSPEDVPTEIPFYLTSTTFMIHEYGDCAQHFKKRLKLFEDEVDLVVMRNVVMSPWPTDGLFINKMINIFRGVLTKHVDTLRKRNNTGPTKHEFLVQGTDKTYAIHFPMFHLEKHRRQFIMEIQFPDEVKSKYLDDKKKETPEDGPYVLLTTEELALHEIANGDKKEIRADLAQRIGKKSNPRPGEDIWQRRIISSNIMITVRSVLKSKSLKGRHRDTSYPSKMMPFYLYGTGNSLCIDHMLVRSPNIILSADNIELQGFTVADDVLAKGAILLVTSVSEEAMQPFQSTDGPLGDTLNQRSDFFFTTNAELDVKVYEDPTAWDQDGPGLVKDVSSWKVIGEGKMKIGRNRYIDSQRLNEDPFAHKEGDVKYKAWKAEFDRIGKKLK